MEDQEMQQQETTNEDLTDTQQPEETEQQRQERLLAGKYRSPEELERAYQELQQLQGRQSEELSRLRTLVYNQLQQQTAPPVQASQETVDFGQLSEKIFEDPKVLDKAFSTVASRLENLQKQLQTTLSTIQQRQAEEEFWSKNPDLKPYQNLVTAAAMQVANDPRFVTAEEKMAEVARRARSEIQRILQSGGTQNSKPPRVEPGGGVRSASSSIPSRTAKPQLSPEEEYLMERMKFIQSRTKPVRGGE